MMATITRLTVLLTFMIGAVAFPAAAEGDGPSIPQEEPSTKRKCKAEALECIDRVYQRKTDNLAVCACLQRSSCPDEVADCVCTRANCVARCFEKFSSCLQDCRDADEFNKCTDECARKEERCSQSCGRLSGCVP